MRRILTILMLVAVSAAAAQERFDHIFRRNPWNGGLNAAGIRQDSLSRSYAEIYFTKENGGLAGHSASDDSWNAGAKTESVRHLKKVSFSGGFGYDYFDGRNMCGSMFTEPGYYPVDILEFTPGRKVREDYTFTGGVSAVLGNRWTGGLRVEFEARNYAKRKDLRHKNTRLDFEFSPGVMYHAGRFAVGAVYIVGTNSEKVAAEGVGPGADLYEAFFDRGLLYGSLEKWGSTDIHLSTNGVSGFPVRENTQGGGVQLQYGPFYADVAYRNRQGETGESRIIWHLFETHQVTANAALSLGTALRRHFVRVNLDWQTLGTDENIITTETINGVQIITIHGSTPTFGRKGLDLGGEYEFVAPHTDLRAGVGYSQLNRESTLMYPYVKGQKLPLYEDICLADPHVRPLGADPRGGLSPGRFHGARKAVRDPRRAAGRVSRTADRLLRLRKRIPHGQTAGGGARAAAQYQTVLYRRIRALRTRLRSGIRRAAQPGRGDAECRI